jgi:acetyl-CoA carboxylase biotin carboxyl carrier protein
MSTKRDSAATASTPQTASGTRIGDAIEGIDALAEAALRLLDSVAQRPERLRVSAGELSVDLDWRTTPVRVVAAGDAPAAYAAQAPGDSVAASPSTSAESASPAWHQINAPTVGTFYHAPSPGSAPFVVEGDVIAAGQQIGIVEAMKLMVPVESDQAGRVVSVHVADGKPVEYGEPLVSLGPVHPGPA